MYEIFCRCKIRGFYLITKYFGDKIKALTKILKFSFLATSLHIPFQSAHARPGLRPAGTTKHCIFPIPIFFD